LTYFGGNGVVEIIYRLASFSVIMKEQNDKDEKKNFRFFFRAGQSDQNQQIAQCAQQIRPTKKFKTPFSSNLDRKILYFETCSAKLNLP